MKLAPLFTSQRQTWRTPTALYAALNKEFQFTLDPCPPEETDYDGLLASWAGERVFVNPPYNACRGWVTKCWTEAPECGVVVALLPSRTDTSWFHDYALRADEIRFVRGRLSYDNNLSQKAPFPSMVVVWGRPVIASSKSASKDRSDLRKHPFLGGHVIDTVQIDPLPARERFLLLRIERDACQRLEYELATRREMRDRIALQLVAEGYSWRDVASVAGFANTYIAALKRRRSA